MPNYLKRICKAPDCVTAIQTVVFFGDGCVPCIHVLDLIVIHHHLYWFYCFFSHSVLNLPWTFVLYFRPKYGDHSHTDSAHVGIIAKKKTCEESMQSKGEKT